MHRNIATGLGRVLIALLGLGLLLVSFKLKVWWQGGIHQISAFGALIGLFVGYGLVGDVWGARLFDFFARTRSRKAVAEPLPPMAEKVARFLGVIVAGLLVLALVFMYLVATRRG